MALNESDLKGRGIHKCNQCGEYTDILNDIYFHEGKCMKCRDYIKDSEALKKMRKPLWLRDVGSLSKTSKCPCCGIEISFNNFVACHVEAEVTSRNCDLSNLRIGCKQCNLEMHRCNYYDWLEYKQGRAQKPKQPSRTHLMDQSGSIVQAHGIRLDNNDDLMYD